MDNVEGGAVSVCISFNRAGIEMGVFSLYEHVVTHPQATRAKGCSASIQVYTPVIEEMGKGLFGVAGERDNRNNPFSPEVRIVGVGVVMTVTAKDRDNHIEAVLPDSL